MVQILRYLSGMVVGDAEFTLNLTSAGCVLQRSLC
jgi:hypothetical protein